MFTGKLGRDWDGCGRWDKTTRVQLPDGHEQRFIYGPWRTEAWDEHDNDPTSPFFETPATTHLDGKGRVFLQVEVSGFDGPSPVEHKTRLVLDVQGNPVEVIDPWDNTIQVQRFDLLGRALFTGAADEGYDTDSPSTDKGKTTVLPAADSEPIRTWRSGGLTKRHTFDALRRPKASYVDEGQGERMVQLQVYGDELTDPGDATHVGDNFLLGQLYQVYDTAGRLTFAYDFRGRTLLETRQLFTDIETEADWDGLQSQSSIADIESWVDANGGLESETFEVETLFDALDRVLEQTTPDSSKVVPGYDAGGELTQVEVYPRGDATPTTPSETSPRLPMRRSRPTSSPTPR